MKVAIDGGALCAPEGKQYGTYRFTTELLKALSLYGKHDYIVYSFCTIPRTKQEKELHYKAITPSFGWNRIRLPLELQSTKPDVFLGLNQALPWGFKGRKIVFSHGLSFQYYPEYYKVEFSRLQSQLLSYVKNADSIVVSSNKVSQEMKEVFPDLTKTITTLPFGFAPIEKKVIRKPKLFFLYVGSDQGIKNVSGLLHVFTEFWKKNKASRFKLLLVGTNRTNLPPCVEQISFANHKKLQELYQDATAYVSCSFYESFNYPVLEALSSNCPVIALKSAIIPEQESFVHTADTMEDLEFLMVKASQGAFEKETPSAVERIFNWKHYISQLEKLYTA